MKKYILLSLLFLFMLPILVVAEEIPVYFFWGDGCPFCMNQKSFMEQLENDYPEIKVVSLETYYDRNNQALMAEAGSRLGVNITGVPFTIIGDDYVSGFGGPDSSGKQIREMIDYCLENDCPDILAGLVDTDTMALDDGVDNIMSGEDQLARANGGINWPVMLIMISLPLFLVIFLISSNREKKV